MALRFCDSFDHYTALGRKWDIIGGTPQGITSTNARWVSCLALRDDNTDQAVTKVFDTQPTWIVGFGLYFDAISGADKPVMRVIDGGTIQGTLWMSSGTSTLYWTGVWGNAFFPTPFSITQWKFLELKFTIDNAAGSYEWRINEQTQISASGIDTNNGGNNGADRIRLTAGDSNVTSTTRRYDDVYICDGTGSAPQNTFLGDVRIEVIYPNGNGNSSQFDGSDGNQTDNYLLVDESTQDDDTTYVESGDLNDKDTYTYGDLTAAAGTVYGVQHTPLARKSAAGTRQIVSVARLSATEIDGSAKTLTDAYIHQPHIFPTKPGGGAWTVSDVNSAEFGQKVYS